MATLFKRSNGVYYIVYTEEQGRRKWVTTHEKQKNNALKKLLDFSSILRETPSKTCLREFIAEFLSFAEEVYSPGTIDIYKKSLNKLSSDSTGFD